MRGFAAQPFAVLENRDRQSHRYNRAAIADD
jgi:hypothetical protein